MNKMNTVVISILAVTILVIGLVAFAGNRFGAGSIAQAPGQTDRTCLHLNQYDADSDGILNCEDDDWEAPMDGTGYGAMNGNGQRLGNGSGLGRGNGNGTGICRAE